MQLRVLLPLAVVVTAGSVPVQIEARDIPYGMLSMYGP